MHPRRGIRAAEPTGIFFPDAGAGGSLLYILLNPSTATEEHNDPTVERCERRARALGYGGFAVTNLFAFRATRPEDLKRAGAPVGPGNDEAILDGGGSGRTADLRLGRSRLPPRAGRCGRDAAARGRA